MIRRLLGEIRILFDIYERCRQADERALWPVCKEQAVDLVDAQLAFASHIIRDPAWLRLGDVEIARRIGLLS
jgi:hypothetical protein